MLAKGAPELILTRCTHYMLPPSTDSSDGANRLGGLMGAGAGGGNAGGGVGGLGGGTGGGVDVGVTADLHGCRPLPITKEIRRQLQRHLTEESSTGQRVVALALRVECQHKHSHHHNHHNHQRNDKRNASTTPTRNKHYGTGGTGGGGSGGGGSGGGQSSEGDFPYSQEGLTFVGFLSISDPPRVGVREAVLSIRGAGIVVAMVTGDAPEVTGAGLD